MALPAKQTKNLGFLRNLITSSAFISEISSWSPYPHLWPCKRHFCSGRRKAECPEYTDTAPCTPAACAGTSFSEVQLIFHPLAAFRNSWKMSYKVLALPGIHGKASVGLLLHSLDSSKCPSKYNPPMFLQVMRDVQQKVFRGKVSSPNVYWASLILHDNPESSMSLNPWHTELSKETQRKKINSNNNKAKQRCSWAKRNMSTPKSKMPPSKTNSKTINLKLEPSHCSVIISNHGELSYSQYKEPLGSSHRLGLFGLHQFAKQQTQARLYLTSANPLSSITAKTSSWNEPKPWLHKIIWKHLLKENAASHGKKLKAGD